MSLPHTPTASTLTCTSPGPGSSISISVSRKVSGAISSAARISTYPPQTILHQRMKIEARVPSLARGPGHSLPRAESEAVVSWHRPKPATRSVLELHLQNELLPCRGEGTLGMFAIQSVALNKNFRQVRAVHDVNLSV